MNLNLKIRCSSIGKIMAEPKSLDTSLLPEDLAVIARKTKKTEEDKALLAPYLERTLSVGAKTYIEKLAKEHYYDYLEVITGKQMDKGLIVENQSIELYNSVFFTSHKKNTERRENEWLSGECDIIVPREEGIDIKSSWSLATFPATAAQAHDSDYEWQCRGYMALWDVPRWSVAYCLVNTPDELIKYEQSDLHYVDHIDATKRVTVVKYERDLALENRIYVKVEAARKYFYQITQQMIYEHQEAA
jgi:hypothetical protein